MNSFDSNKFLEFDSKEYNHIECTFVFFQLNRFHFVAQNFFFKSFFRITLVSVTRANC